MKNLQKVNINVEENFRDRVNNKKHKNNKQQFRHDILRQLDKINRALNHEDVNNDPIDQQMDKPQYLHMSFQRVVVDKVDIVLQIVRINVGFLEEVVELVDSLLEQSVVGVVPIHFLAKVDVKVNLLLADEVLTGF